jgi:hypothetical protein
LNKDGSMGDPVYNDWTQPTHQYDFAHNVHYLVWTRRYQAIALNQTSVGTWRKVLIQSWNPSSTSATFIDSQEGAPFDTVADLGGSVTRYGSYPTTSYSFLNSSFDTVYLYSIYATGQPVTGGQYALSKFGDFVFDFTAPTSGMAFAEFTNGDFLDWVHSTGGIDYTSYFVSGYKLRGEGIRKFQSNYMQIFMRNEQPSQFDLNGRWDYANTGNTGRWSTTQRVTMDNPDYSYRTRRLKIRGHGKALQFKLNSVTQQPFNLIGWSLFETVNQVP